MAAARPALARALLQQCVSARLQVKPPEHGSEAEWVEVTSATGCLPLDLDLSSLGGAGEGGSEPLQGERPGNAPSAARRRRRRQWKAARCEVVFPFQGPLLTPLLPAKVTLKPFSKATSSTRDPERTCYLHMLLQRC
ncbi:D-aminoacyl-tRNA deacylase 2 isoform X4 [Melanerpes formicivorus]|uniref:D-aminoacyl-tRNA deacylase 2 isoform X4 n=1 Tax=Melanerpes formicivorus TaxID=211600 RepID=UPI00358F353E